MTPFIKPFSIAGEAGKGFGSGAVTAEAFNASQLNLTYYSMASDTFSFVQKRPQTGAWVRVEDAQQITLFDGANRRIFTGKASVESGRSGGIKVSNVSAIGPYDFLRTTTILSNVADGSGATSLRPQFSVPQQAIGTSIRALLALAISQGAKFQIGNLPPESDDIVVTPMSWSQVTYEYVLIEMLSYYTDAGTRMDYEAIGLPKLHIVRRAQARTVVVDFGSESHGCDDLLMQPKKDWIPTAVTVRSVVRDPVTYKPLWRTQSAGGAPGAGAQEVVVSGPENDEDPETDVDSTSVQTVSSDSWAFVAANDPVIVALIAQFGNFNMNIGTGSFKIWTADPNAGGSSSIVSLTRPGYSISGQYRLISQVPDQWAQAQYGLVATPGTFRGHYGGKYGTPGNWYLNAPDWLKALQDQGKLEVHYGYPDGGPYTSANMGAWVYYYASVPITLLNRSYGSATQLYRAPDYDYVDPPANMAQELWDTQQWKLYTGQGTFDPKARDIPVPGEVLSAIGESDFPEWQTARAPLTATQFSLDARSCRITLGVPPRADASSVVEKFRKNTADNRAKTT